MIDLGGYFPDISYLNAENSAEVRLQLRVECLSEDTVGLPLVFHEFLALRRLKRSGFSLLHAADRSYGTDIVHDPRWQLRGLDGADYETVNFKSTLHLGPKRRSPTEPVF